MPHAYLVAIFIHIKDFNVKVCPIPKNLGVAVKFFFFKVKSEFFRTFCAVTIDFFGFLFFGFLYYSVFFSNISLLTERK